MTVVVEIFTDGACVPNPGPGGWGAVLRYGEHERELHGGEPTTTTNNRMELTAPIRALEALTRHSVVHLHTDSTYVRNGITQWLPRWKTRGWRTAAGEPVKNDDLWRELDAAVRRHDVTWFWVKGHSGHPENERADRLAAQGCAEAGGRAAPARTAATGRRIRSGSTPDLPGETPVTDTFPRLHARTRRFSLGVPRGFTVAPDGSRAVFLRTRSGTDPVTCLWSVDAATGEERLLVDPAQVPGLPGEEDLPAAERARRERVREQAGGVVGYTVDAAVERAVFALSGRPFTVALTGDPQVRPLDVGAVEAVVDPRIDPTGSRVAFVADRALHLHDLATGTTTRPAVPDADDVSYGLADFAAAEEMGRTRGFWWSPDGDALLVARVDESPVARWHIADPAHPDRVPAEVRYPAAGTPNAVVGLEIVTLDGTRTPVRWDAGAHEYLATAGWDAHGPLLSVQPRDQREVRTLAVDPATGTTTTLHSQTDPVWVENVPGVPARTESGALVRVTDDGGARRLVHGDTTLTGPDLQVRDVLGIDGETVLFRASADPTSVALYSVAPGGTPVLLSPADGLHSGTAAGGTLVRTSQDLVTAPHAVLVTADGTEHPVAGHAVDPGFSSAPALHAFGERALRTAVFLPSGHVPGTKVPVLLDPYGGPHSQRVVRSRNAHLTSRWFAEQGFAVVVTDGRGSPGRGPEFERAIHGDLAGPVLEDQVAALQAAADEYPDLDLTRVGIRGWSFGGYLAALAVLRRPDVFHAGVAGAPVTDWALYDTHYTERYLGLPGGESYARSSIVDDAATPPTADAPHRPLMIVHGLADDNVVAAHTLRLSSALLAAGRPHQVLPLSGVTHMTPQEVVAENLLLLQVGFLREALGG